MKNPMSPPLQLSRIYGKIIYRGEGVKKEDFHEIAVEKYERILAEEAEKQNNI